MATPVNLNKFRKAKAKIAADRKAHENRALHGLTKAEKTVAKSKQKQADSRLDAHKRSPDRS